MKRRNIKIRSQSDELTRKRRLRDLLVNRLTTPSAIERFAAALEKAGWSAQELEDAINANVATRHGAEDLQAFMPYNYPIVDQLMLSQGVYTAFRHDAMNPNYALRNQGATEITWRRMTFGDTLMMQAAMQLSARHQDDCTDRYWQLLWESLLTLLDVDIDFKNAQEAAAISYLFALNSANKGIEYFDRSNLYETFMRPANPLYTGVIAMFERKRTGDQFADVCTFYQIDDGDESLYLSAIATVCYGLDNIVKGRMWGDQPSARPITEIFKVYLNHLRHRPIIETDIQPMPKRERPEHERTTTITRVDGGTSEAEGGITIEGQSHAYKKTTESLTTRNPSRFLP